MHEIEIKYKTFFCPKSIKTSFPETWSEMNVRQFAALFNRPDDIHLLAAMLNVRPRIIRKLDLYQIYELAKLFDFIKRDTKINYFKFDKLHLRKTEILFAPKPKLMEMPFEQFIYVDSFYMQYTAAPNNESLRYLVAYLYTPPTGFHKPTAERNVKLLKSVKPEILEAIALNYGWVRKWIIERYPIVFPSSGKKQTASTTGSWPDVFDSIVGDDLKDRDKYAQLPINVIFKYITRKIKESRKNAAKIH